MKLHEADFSSKFKILLRRISFLQIEFKKKLIIFDTWFNVLGIFNLPENIKQYF